MVCQSLYYFLLFSLKIIDYEYLLELLHRCSSIKHHNKENIINYHSINVLSRSMKYRIILYRQVNVLYSTTVKSIYKDHLWDCPKVVLKTTFGQSQRWSLIRGTLGLENEEKNNLKFANKVFNR